MNYNHNDTPIARPEEDAFGIAPFDESLADGLRKMDAQPNMLLT